jgi:hypothetical protein
MRLCRGTGLQYASKQIGAELFHQWQSQKHLKKLPQVPGTYCFAL